MATASDRAAALNHRYRITHDGDDVPGVTSAIGVLEIPQLKWASSEIAAATASANIDNMAEIVVEYRAKLMAAGGSKEDRRKKQILATEGTDVEVFNHWCRGAFDREWKAKSKRGSDVHDIAQAWGEGKSATVPKELNGYVNALEQFHVEFRPVSHLTECVVLNQEFGYGGRFDRVATLDHPQAFGTFMLDWKTGRHYVQPVAMQEVAYKHGELPIYNGLGHLTGFKPLPDIDGVRAIYLGEDGTLTVIDPFDVIPEAIAWSAFQKALALFKAVKEMNQLEKEDGYDDGDE